MANIDEIIEARKALAPHVLRKMIASGKSVPSKVSTK